jgi:undecaprenyl-phosphate 4-deoxy-4-formamido-L-arabinose transferase
LLREIAERDGRVSVIELSRNAGQHAAVLAGFAASRGATVVTLDGDLQNPPEEIPRLLAAIDAGNDVVGTWRENRNDPLMRRVASALINQATSATVGVRMRDYGCMLRAYKHEIVDQIVECNERSLFIPALANTLAQRTTELEVGHAERAAGRSKYRFIKLMRLGFDLMTGFSLLPIQLVSLAGIVVALAGIGFGAFLFVRRLFVGPEVEGVFTLFAILFVFLGILILAVGLVGEYIGRIYLEVRHRPAYRVRAVHRRGSSAR